MKKTAYFGSAAAICTIALVFVLLGYAPPVYTVTDTQCGKCYDNSDASAHTFGSTWPWLSYFNADCFAANTCHLYSGHGGCREFHVACRAFHGGEVSKAVEARDGAALASLLRAHPERAHYDPAAHALTLHGCDGRDIVIQLPPGLSIG